MERETREHMERIYGGTPESDIPWNRDFPPAVLVELVDRGVIKPCKALDIGCGTGNYSIFLKSKGFDVTGVDISANAIEIARKKAPDIDFVNADMRGEVAELGGLYGFALEWMIMHHILPGGRESYIRNIADLLETGGIYLSVSFSASDPNFGDPPSGSLRKSPLGPMVYMAELNELADSLTPHFSIDDKKLIEIPGFKGDHIVNYLIMRRR